MAPKARTRRIRYGSVFLAAIAIPLALVTLFGMEPVNILPGDLSSGVAGISQILIQLVTIVAALTVVIGILNLISVHTRNLGKMPSGLYSLITLITMGLVVAVGILERTGTLKVTGVEGTPVRSALMDGVQVAIESALAGMLFFFLVYSAYRLMRKRITIWNVLFITALVIVLLGNSPVSGMGYLSALRDWVLNVPVNAGTRGLLIGIAIGTIVVGVRLLMGQERTFRE